MSHRHIVPALCLLSSLLGCEQEETQGRLEDAAVTDEGLPPVSPRPDGAAPVIPSPPDPCADSQAIDFAALARPLGAGVLVYDGQLQDDAGFTGSCGGGGSEAYDQVVRFAAPEAGAWQFVLTPRALRGQVFGSYDPVLHARSTCEDPESERACNDDIAAGRLESRLRLELDAGEEVFLVVDTVGRAINARYELSARRLPIVQVGEVCDVASELNGCAQGSYCRADPDVRGPEGVCAPDEPPVIAAVIAYAQGDDLGLVIEGTDTGADVQQAFLNLLDADGEVIILNEQGADTYILDPIEPVFGQEAFTFRFVANLLAGFPQTGAVQVQLLDARGNRSERAVAEPQRAGPVPEGQPCDRDRIRDVCPAPTRCMDPDADGVAGCIEPTAPVLNRAKGFYDPDTLLTGYQVSGVDPDRDVRGVALSMLNADGDQVAGGDRTFDFVEWDGDRFTALFSLALLRDRGAVSATLIPFDAEGLRGPAFDAGLLDPPITVDVGETCDPLEAQARCRGEAFCHQAGEGQLPECGRPDAECPEAWGEPIDLNAWEDRDEWRFAGDLTTRYNVTRGSCGGGAAQAIFSFTAPEAGAYSFVTYSRAGGADTVLYARSHCGFDPARAAVELACNDDISIENAFSLIDLELAEGERVFVIVDGGNDGTWVGGFDLTARRQP